MENKTTKSDLKSVAQWLKTTIENLDIQYVKEPMSNYVQSAKEMLNTYEEFPQDKKRTDKIMRLLKSGKDYLPVYVEKDDKDNFIMEGRHRIVAFYLLGSGGSVFLVTSPFLDSFITLSLFLASSFWKSNMLDDWSCRLPFIILNVIDSLLGNVLMYISIDRVDL